ncbi:disease resistance protein RUN1-like [Rosa rugosa]|uniref:disease resistance protein RUN1-like n=1 Tax=Rosa rugosa TaxID=74645 RepID=UPI002B40872B|nr:disease resistance protein RUN1-like [Rosa rugosa]
MLNSMEDFVGIESKFNKLRFLLCSSVDDVRFVGIWGMGGIGKTTLARALYGNMSHEYQFSTFLPNVRSISDGMNGLCHLQKKLLSGIGMIKDDIWDPHEGVALIRRYLYHKKVLLILDDVNNMDQLEYLAGKQEWFCPGSRIVITTRDEHLLIAHGVQRRFKVEGLPNSQALKLFSLKAFKKDYPPDDYLGLSRRVVHYAKGLPLAVKVLGSFLHGRRLSAWNSTLGKLSEVFNSEILEILKISYDGLRDNEKKIFLDIACFFNGDHKDQVIKTLDNCGNSASIGIDVLVERSLLTVTYSQILMHDLLQEMGRELVCRESPDEPGGRSRLWHWEDVNHVLSKNTGTGGIESILVNPAKSRMVMHVIHANAKSFLMMSKLRLLIINDVNLANGLECFPDDLRVIEWSGYPLKYFPSHFNPEKLLELNMSHSHIEHFWTGIKALYKLRSINLCHSLSLIDTPDFRGMPYLECLILEGCIQLYRVHSSLGTLERLTLINLRNCTNLVHFPSSVCGLKSLKVLDVSGCSRLQKLPDDLGCAECLEELDVSGTAIREPPPSIGLLKNLKELSCRGCKAASPKPWYMRLPFGLSLERSQDPSSKFWNMIPFRLSLARTPHPTSWAPRSFASLRSLVKLDLTDCNLFEGAIPNDISCMASLTKLNLSRNHFASLPSSIFYLSKLEDLNLEYCERLQTMPALPSQVELNACNCVSLERWSVPIERCKLLLSANLTNCFKLGKQGCRTLALTLLKRYLEGVPYLYRLESGLRFVVPGNEIPDWFTYQSVGSSVYVDVHPGFSGMYMGFAGCAVFEIKGMVRFRKRKRDGLGTSRTLSQAVSHHLWFEYTPRHIHYEDWPRWQHCRRLKFSFEFGGQDIVKKCGVRIVYEPDIQSLNESLKKSNFGTSPDYALKFPGKAAAVSAGSSTKYGTLEHHDEAAPSGSGYHGSITMEPDLEGSVEFHIGF